MARRSRGPMTESELSAFINNRILSARTYLENEIASERSRNLRYALGEPFGNEVEGHSAVVSMDVHDTVESLMPDVMEILASGPVVQFSPVGPEDEELAKQVTDYVNEVVWTIDNEGFKVSHDWTKDTLLEKNGVVKVFWDDSEREHFEDLENVSLASLTQFQEAENIEIVAAEITGEQPIPDGMGGQETQPLYSVKLKRVDPTGKLIVDVLASERFGIDASDKALDEHTSFCYDRVTQKTRSDWVEMGFDEDLIYSIPSDDDLISDRSRRTARARNADQQSSLTQWSSNVSDPSMQRITIFECYPRMSYDGDGIAKRYLVWAGGSDGDTLLPDPESGDLATEVSDHPFVDMTAIRQPHRWAGRALADEMRDIQEIKSTLQRQLLDNVYNINNARAGVSNKVSLDDYLTNDVAGVIEVDTDGADVAGHIHQLAPNYIGDGILQAIEYFDKVGQSRSGVSQNTALDPEALHKTASGANLMLGEMHKRMLYMVRMMAETGFVPLFNKMVKIIADNQDFVRTVRLRGKWVDIDPRSWTVEFDVKPNVGLGHGTRTDKVASANAIIEKQALLVQQQGGIEGPFVYADNVSNALQLFSNNLGVSTPELYYSDPETREYKPPEPEPSPEMAKVQADAEQAKAELELKAQKQAAEQKLDEQKAAAEQKLDAWKALQEVKQKWAELEAKAGLQAGELQAKYGLKAEELKIETVLEVMAIKADDPSGQGNIPSVVNG